MSKFLQGIYRPKFPAKYKGDANNIIYRSSWELSVLRKLDLHPDVLQYSSEEVVIRYISPVDGKPHRYFVDFYAKYKTRDGKIVEVLMEVKPYAQTLPPKTANRKPRRLLTEIATYGVNQAKWAAARAYCAQKGWVFQIITEKDLPGMGKK